MPGGRVLSTETARGTINDLKALVQGDLPRQVDRVRKDGDTLAQPDVWDGKLADQFRSDQWPHMHQELQRAVKDLEDLRVWVDKIAHDIMHAGGNE